MSPRELAQELGFSALIGAAITTAILSLLLAVPDPLTIRLLLIGWCATLLLCAFLQPLSKSFDGQLRWLPLIATVGVLAYAQSLRGAGTFQLALYIVIGVVGGAIAGVLPGRLPALALAAGGALLTLLQSNAIGAPPNATLSYAVIIITLTIALLSAVAVTKESSDLGYATMLLVLGAGTWQLLRLRGSVSLAGATLDLAAVLPSIVLALALGWPIWFLSRLRAPLWLPPLLDNWLLTFRLMRASATGSRSTAAILVYQESDPDLRKKVLTNLLILQPAAVLHLLRVTAPQMRHSVLAELPSAAQATVPAKQGAIRVLQAGMRSKESALALECLQKLTEIDGTTALQACWRCLNDQRLDVKQRMCPIQHYITNASFQTFGLVLRDLVIAAREQDEPVQREILQFANTLAGDRRPDRAAAAVLVLAHDDPLVVSHMIQQGGNVLTTLEQASHSAQSLRYRRAIAAVIDRSIADPTPKVWQASLATLTRIDRARAIGRVQQLLSVGNQAPLLYLLHRAENPTPLNEVRLDEGDYWALLRLLIDTTIRTDGPAAARDLLIKKYRVALPMHAAGILAELMRMADTTVLNGKGADSGLIAQLYQQRRPDGITPALLQLGARADLRGLVIEILRLGLGLLPDQQAKLSDPNIDLQKVLFPFVLRQLTPKQSIMHMEETLNDTATNITGSRITVWPYRHDGRVTDLVLAGHANTPVCKEVSSKLFSAFIAQSSGQGENSLLVPGAVVLRASPAAEAGTQIASLDTLTNELAQIGQQTGLLDIRSTNRSYQDVCDDLRRQIEQGLHDNQASVQWRWQPHVPDNAVILPFYVFHPDGPQQLSLNIPLDRFAGPAFDRLLEAHQRAVRKGMVEDALRRKVVYESWLGQHKNTLIQHVRQAIDLLLPTAAAPTREELAQQYHLELLDSVPAHKRERALYDWFRVTFPQLGLKSPNRLDEEEIASAVRLVRQNLPDQYKEQFSRVAVQDLLTFLRQHQALPSSALAGILHHQPQQLFIRDIPVSGEIDWGNTRINYEPGQVLEYIDIVTAIYNLPDIIHTDEQWIKRMTTLLGYIDDAARQNKEALEKINLGSLLDSFLRGWPPVFLEGTHEQDDYNMWVAERREQVWQYIHLQLLNRGLRIDPLCADNVVFAIQRHGANSVRVTPYVLTTDQTCTVFLHRHFGMTTYVYPWQFRERVALSGVRMNNTTACQKECAAAEQALQSGDTSAAIEHFSTALRIHPAKAASTIFQRAWQVMRAPTSDEMASRLALAQAVAQLDEHQLPNPQIVRAFVDSHPSFLPDPYLLLAYLGHEQARQISAAGQKLRDLHREWRSLTLDLEAFRQDVRMAGEVRLDRRYEHHRNVEDRLQRIQQIPKLIEESDQHRRDLERALWKSLGAQQNPHVLKALSLDSAYVNTILAEGKFQISTHFRRYVLPMLSTFQALEQTRIADDLRVPLRDAEAHEGDLQQISRITKALKKQIDTHIQNMWISEQTSRALTDLYHILVHIDTITPFIENQIRVQLREIIEQLQHLAFQQYSSAADRLPELTGPRKNLTGQLFRGALYRAALSTLIGGRTMPLMSAFATGRYTLGDTELFEIVKLQWDSATQTALAQDQAGAWRNIVRFHGLSQDEGADLERTIAHSRFAIKLNATKPPLAPAYNLLHAPITVPQLTERWQRVLQGLERPLVCAMAYLGVDPSNAELPSEITQIYERSPIIVDVNISCASVGDKFTAEVYAWASDAWRSAACSTT